MKDGYVYLMKPVGHNVYKIGETINPHKRLEVYQKKFDCKLQYVDYAQVGEDNKWIIERKLHLKFWRYHLGGDWFVLPDDAVSNFRTLVREELAELMG